jgi:hypothetical protein
VKEGDRRKGVRRRERGNDIEQWNETEEREGKRLRSERERERVSE